MISLIFAHGDARKLFSNTGTYFSHRISDVRMREKRDVWPFRKIFVAKSAWNFLVDYFKTTNTEILKILLKCYVSLACPLFLKRSGF